MVAAKWIARETRLSEEGAMEKLLRAMDHMAAPQLDPPDTLDEE